MTVRDVETVNLPHNNYVLLSPSMESAKIKLCILLRAWPVCTHKTLGFRLQRVSMRQFLKSPPMKGTDLY